MLSSLRHLSVKALFFALGSCYLLPLLITTTVLDAAGSAAGDGLFAEGARLALHTLPTWYLLFGPAAAGAAVARLAPGLPWLHALCIGLLGATASLFAMHSPPFWFEPFALVSNIGGALFGAALTRRRQHRK
jgi:hypothetical protein